MANRERQQVLSARTAALEWYNRKGSDRKLNFWQLFKCIYKGRVTLNTRTQELILDNDLSQVVTREGLIDAMEERLGILRTVSKDLLREKFDEMIKGYEFDPVKDYLTGLMRDEETGERWKPDDTALELWYSMGSRWFGLDDPLTNTMLQRYLMSAVERGLHPGSQVDAMLVLTGKQGARKTTWGRVMFGDYFSTLHSHVKGDDRTRLLQRFWGVEMGEIEATFSQQSIATLKAVITETSDDLIPKFKEKPVSYARRNVFFGSTNKRDFLTDSTGSRRFMVIELPKGFVIPIDTVEADRDTIWRTAVYMLMQGEQHYLTPEEQAESDRRNLGYSAENTIEERITERVLLKLDALEHKLMDGHYWALSRETLLYVAGIQGGSDKKYSDQISDALDSLGWVKSSKRFGQGAHRQLLRVYHPADATGIPQLLTIGLLSEVSAHVPMAEVESPF